MKLFNFSSTSTSASAPCPIPLDNLTTSLEDDFIYLVYAVNKHNQKITVAITSSQSEAEQVLNDFKVKHANDRYYLDVNDQVIVLIEKKQVAKPYKPAVTMNQPRE